MTPDEIESRKLPWQWDKIREICRKHDAEFVEHRRDLAEYLTRTGLKPDDLLWDHVHQNLHEIIRIWDSVSRHIVKPEKFNYAPESRERFISATQPATATTEQLELSGSWTKVEGAVRTGAAGSQIKIRFTGNRIDIIGRKTPKGGAVKLFIDGKPGDQAPALLTTLIKATEAPKVPRPFVHNAQGCSPHAVTFGTNAVPQKWTITMTSDTGDYRLDGSVTGADGEGNVARLFRSTSGQIEIDPKFWRSGRLEMTGRPVEKRNGKSEAVWSENLRFPVRKEDGKWIMYGDVKGDSFNFEVYRSARGELSFRSEKPASLAESAACNLPNGEHTLEIVAMGDGDVTIEGLYVFQPPEKE